MHARIKSPSAHQPVRRVAQERLCPGVQLQVEYRRPGPLQHTATLRAALDPPASMRMHRRHGVGLRARAVSQHSALSSAGQREPHGVEGESKGARRLRGRKRCTRARACAGVHRPYTIAMCSPTASLIASNIPLPALPGSGPAGRAPSRIGEAVVRGSCAPVRASRFSRSAMPARPLLAVLLLTQASSACERARCAPSALPPGVNVRAGRRSGAVCVCVLSARTIAELRRAM